MTRVPLIIVRFMVWEDSGVNQLPNNAVGSAQYHDELQIVPQVKRACLFSQQIPS